MAISEKLSTKIQVILGFQANIPAFGDMQGLSEILGLPSFKATKKGSPLEWDETIANAVVEALCLNARIAEGEDVEDVMGPVMSRPPVTASAERLELAVDVLTYWLYLPSKLPAAPQIAHDILIGARNGYRKEFLAEGA